MFDHVWIVCLKQALEEATRQLREQEVPEFEANIGTPGIHFRENPRTSKNKHNTGHTGLIIINYPGFMIPLCSSAQKSTFPSAIFSLSRVSGLQAQLSSQAARLTLLEKQVLHWELLGASGWHTLYINLYGVIPCYTIYTEFCIFYVWNWLQLCICVYVNVTYKNTYVLHTHRYISVRVWYIYIYKYVCVYVCWWGGMVVCSSFKTSHACVCVRAHACECHWMCECR